MINRARTADKPDAFDVAGLEKSINDSAVRVSTIWVTYLIFALYLVIAAGTITDRQLLLRDPVKLPVLNIDLPLWGFFFVTPILFVIFHAYVLLQVLLLGRTAAAYNEARSHDPTTPCQCHCAAAVGQHVVRPDFRGLTARARRCPWWTT